MPDTFFGISQRLPPMNVEAEQALLGAILANNAAYERVSEFLQPEHFADPINARIYKVVAARLDAGQPTDGVTLKGVFEHSGVLEEVGGTKYLAQLLTAMVGIINAGEYGRAIRDAWIKRQMIDFGEEVVNSAFGNGADVQGSELLEQAEQRLFAIATSSGASDAGPVMLGEAMTAAEEEAERAKTNPEAGGLSTGLPSLDSAILGLRAGHLVVIGGRPGMGKTALAKTIALNVAGGLGTTPDDVDWDDPSRGQLCAYFNLEETDVDFGASAMAQFSRVPIGKILGGTASSDEAMRAVRAKQRLFNAPLAIFSKPRQTASVIARQCRLLERRRRQKLRLVVVDYLQLMPDFPGQKDKRLAVGANAYALKDLAKELGCTVLLLSQLSRAVDSRTDKRPTMSDLRETGEIEDAADAILFPYREAYYFEQTRPVQDFAGGEPLPTFQLRLSEWQAKFDAIRDDAEFIIPKVRRAPAPAHRYVKFDGPATRFGEPPRRDGW